MPRAAAPTGNSDAGQLTRPIAVVGAALACCALVVGLTLADVTTGTFALMVPVGGLIAVGTLIVVRRRGNLVGWLCWLSGLLGTLAFASGAYTEHAVSSAIVTPGVDVIGWFSLWLGEAWVTVLLLIPLVFPDGRLPSRRWRPLAALAVAAAISFVVAHALDPVVNQSESLQYNPFGVHAAARVFASLEEALAIGYGLLLVTGVSAPVARFRRGTSGERRQIMWLLYAVTLVAALLAFDSVAPNAMSTGTSDVVFGLGYGTLPIAIGVAVLRYRLYDIDHIIRRTIVYAVLTAFLGLVYALGVLVVGSVVGGDRRSDLAVAASTLAAAALFRPMRHRTQLAVDRRFNRRRFDANRTAASFSAAVRDELDADALARELLTVTRRAVEPTAVWLWRPAAGSGSAGRRQ